MMAWVEIVNGLNNEDVPNTMLIFRMFAPRMLPMDKFLCPLIRAVTEVTSSGSEVPSAMAVKLTMI